MPNLHNFFRPIIPNINIIKLELALMQNQPNFTKNIIQILQISHNTGYILLNLIQSQYINNGFNSMQCSIYSIFCILWLIYSCLHYHVDFEGLANNADICCCQQRVYVRVQPWYELSWVQALFDVFVWVGLYWSK